MVNKRRQIVLSLDSLEEGCDIDEEVHIEEEAQESASVKEQDSHSRLILKIIRHLVECAECREDFEREGWGVLVEKCDHGHIVAVTLVRKLYEEDVKEARASRKKTVGLTSEHRQPKGSFYV